MTSDGHSYARFRRALDNDNLTAALASAAELPHVGLVEALELLLLIRDNEPAKFGRAALRWHGRFCRETLEVDFDEAQAVLAALGALRGSPAKAAARALAELLYRRSMERACEVLLAWAS